MFNTRILSGEKTNTAAQASAHHTGTPVAYSDLGLPSGTLWAGLSPLSFDRPASREQAVREINNIPTLRQWIELLHECHFRVRTQSPALLRGESPNRKEVILPLKGQLFGRAVGTVRCWAKDEATGLLMVLRYTDAKRFEFVLAEDDTKKSPQCLLKKVKKHK